MYKRKRILLALLVVFSLNTNAYAESVNDNDQSSKIAELEKRINQLEVNKPKAAEPSKVTFSGLFSYRYKSVDYDQADKAGTVQNQYRFRLNGKVLVDKDSSIGFRFVTKAPDKADRFNNSWTTFGADNDLKMDMAYYTTKLGNGAGRITVGQQPLVIDPMNLIVDSTFYSYGGGSISYKLKGLGKDGAITAQHGRFYSGATLSGFTGWGNKSATDFNNADITSLIVNGKVDKVTYTVGHAAFKNNTNNKNLLTYNFINAGIMLSPKVGLSSEYANNSADDDGSFWSNKIVYGDQVPSKAGQWNVSLQHTDAGKNAIFNRFAMLEGGTGKNTNHPETIWDAKVTYAVSPTTTLYVQRMIIDDKVAANNAGDSKIWKAELGVKF